MFVPTRLSEDQERALESIQTEGERKKMKEVCISSILVLSQNESPIKKTDLNRLVLTGSRHYRAVNAITVEANRDLIRIFGMRLYELEDKSRYILVNISSDYSLYARRSQSKKEQFNVLFFILIDIFASAEEKISQNEMINTLSALNIGEKDLKEHIDALVKKLYISRVKDPMHQDTILFTWGPRAIAEIDPDKLFSSFLSLTDDGNGNNWPEQKARIERFKTMSNRQIVGVL